ncbi:MAG: hypothetical protein M3131_02565 [Actinomycetota bacterium]|nr:hypothetical protein [Actinomycetota bacterium]
MVIVELVCSDEDCAVTVEAVAGSLDELDTLVCEDCECTLQTLTISAVELVELEPPVELHALPRAA